MHDHSIETLGGYLTLKAAAKKLGMNRDALYARMYRRRVPTVRIGRVILVRLEDVSTTKRGVSQ